MKKPIKPTKQILVPCVAYPPDGVSLEYLDKWCKEHQVPTNAELKLIKENDYDEDGSLGWCSAYLELHWEEYQDDPKYDEKIKKLKKRAK